MTAQSSTAYWTAPGVPPPLNRTVLTKRGPVLMFAAFDGRSWREVTYGTRGVVKMSAPECWLARRREEVEA